MNSNRRTFAALIGAGLLWGTTVPLSKLALHWLPPGWLTFVRFAVAAAILLPAARHQLRAAFRPAVLASGALGYGGSVLLQNAGITRTSVTHAALLIGAVPVMVAVIAAVWQRAVARPVAWAGFALALAGVGLVTGGHGGGASTAGDALVLASLLVSATFTVAQTRLLAGRDPVAATAVQFLGAALAVLPFAAVTEGRPSVPGAAGPVLATAALAAGGTLLPFALFAYAQSRVPAEVAGAFFNIEPFVGAAAGAVFFGNPVGPGQLAGGAAVLAGIALSSLPLLAGRRGGATGEQRQDTRRPRQRPRLLSQRPLPRSPQPRSAQPRSAQPRSAQSRNPQSRNPQSRNPQSRNPRRRGPRPRNAPSRRPSASRPPPRPGPARRAAYRAAARACRWAFTRHRPRADRGAGARCRSGAGEPPPPQGRARCRSGAGEPPPPQGRARCRSGAGEPPPPPVRCGATLPLSLVHGGPRRQRVRH